MEGGRLLHTIKYGDITVERYVMNEGPEVMCDDDCVGGEMTIFEKVIYSPSPPPLKKRRGRPFKFKEVKIKQKRLKPLSKVPKGLQQIMWQQLFDRRQFSSERISWESWCRDNYDIDANK